MDRHAFIPAAAVLAAIAGLLLSAGPGRAAPACSDADLKVYEKLVAPKALVGNSTGCTTYSGLSEKSVAVINAALVRCFKTTRDQCEVIGWEADDGQTEVVVAMPAPPPVVVTPTDPCPGGDRISVTLGKEPVRINPNGLCALTVWYRHCVFVRQAGETKAVGPYCPPEATQLPNAVKTRAFPPDVEMIWSAEEEPFTAYYLLYRDGEAPKQVGLSPGTKEWREACAKKYKSFDWTTGLYVAAGGTKRECKL